MIEPSRNQFPTTAQQLAAANARMLLESEPRPAFALNGHNIHCTNPDAMNGQRNYIVVFVPENDKSQSFDGRHWDNFPV